MPKNSTNKAKPPGKTYTRILIGCLSLALLFVVGSEIKENFEVSRENKVRDSFNSSFYRHEIVNLTFNPSKCKKYASTGGAGRTTKNYLYKCSALIEDVRYNKKEVLFYKFAFKPITNILDRNNNIEKSIASYDPVADIAFSPTSGKLNKNNFNRFSLIIWPIFVIVVIVAYFTHKSRQKQAKQNRVRP